MNIAKLLAFFDARRSRGEPLVLASLVETEGSTYSKVGDFVLIDANGVVCGMLSGGCLETDLAVRAESVIATGQAQLVTYELGGDDEEIWGLGTGCGGMMRIHLQGLTDANGYDPLASLAEALARRQTGSFIVEHEQLDAPVELAVAAPPRVLIVGLGKDAEPLVRILDETGVACELADHRPALVDASRFPPSCTVHPVSIESLAETLDLATFDAAVVMTHQIASDRSCLRQLADSEIRHIGLLGPAARRERLLDELGDETAARLAHRLEGPAGLALGGRGPEAIALSIAAWLQLLLSNSRVRNQSAAEDRPA